MSAVKAKRLKRCPSIIDTESNEVERTDKTDRNNTTSPTTSAPPTLESDQKKNIIKIKIPPRTLLEKIIYTTPNVELKKYLQELNYLIGQEQLKHQVAQQVLYLLNKTNTTRPMLHTVLSGPPGTGKTTIGKILCGVYKSILGDSKEPTLESKPSGTALPTVGSSVAVESRTNNHTLPTLESSSDSESALDQGDTYDPWEQIYTLLDEIYYRLENLYTPKNRRKIDELTDIVEQVHIHIDSLANDVITEDPPDESDQEDNKDSPDKANPISSLVNQILSSFQQEDPGDINPDPSIFTPDFVMVSRQNFISSYEGQSAQKTQKLLNSVHNRVLFIDEAYSLCIDEQDSYGQEALSTLNQHMSNHPETIVIFAGYKDKLEETIFKFQPGLQRRCTWVFDTKEYTYNQLYQIMVHKNPNIPPKSQLLPLLEQNYFPGNAGDIDRVLFYSDLDKLSNLDIPIDTSLSLQNITNGLKTLRDNQALKPDPMPEWKRIMYA